MEVDMVIWHLLLLLLQVLLQAELFREELLGRLLGFLRSINGCGKHSQWKMCNFGVHWLG
jgi:hypothetical protein